MTLGLSAGVKVCDDCMTEYSGPAYYTFPTDECRTSAHDEDPIPHAGCTGNLCPRCAGPDLEPDRADDPRRPVRTHRHHYHWSEVKGHIDGGPMPRCSGCGAMAEEGFQPHKRGLD